MERNGCAVQIKRKDGTTFLACSHPGILPAIWPLSQRRFAVEHRRELQGHGFDAKVVRVVFNFGWREPVKRKTASAHSTIKGTR